MNDQSNNSDRHLESESDTESDCLFCHVHNSSINDLLVDGDTCYVRWDNYPAAKGHIEVVPKRHIESYFDITENEALEAYDLIKRARRILDAKYRPAGYTIGVNEGRAAGRTIDHLHIHLIPRYVGDVDDPRGGVRHVLPGTNPDRWAAQ